MKQNTCAFRVEGMHCAACEVLLEKRIKEMPGVQHVKAQLADKTIEIKGSVNPQIRQKLNSMFSELGYHFVDKTDTQSGNLFQTIISLIGIGIITTIALLILDDIGALSQISISSESSYIAFFILGVVASISTCAALVGGLIVSLSKQWHERYGSGTFANQMEPALMFHTGRLVSFTVFGGILGLIGSVFSISVQATSLLVFAISFVMILLGLQMLGFGFAKRLKLAAPRFISDYITDEKHFTGRYMPYLVGALTFFVPCGFTLMAQTAALAVGNPWQSMLMMAFFAFGTLPVLGLISLGSMRMQKSPFYAHAFNLVAGIVVIGFAIYSINSQLNVLGMKSLSDVGVLSTPARYSLPGEESGVVMMSVNGERYQQVTLKAEGFAYTPRTLTLKAGVPVRLKVKNNNPVGCAQAMYMPGLYDQVLYLTGAETDAEFTPQKPGIYKISCTMGMVPPIIVTVES